MALSNDEKQVLRELKSQGFSYAEAMGFIGANRMGNQSRVSRQLMGSSTEDEINQPEDGQNTEVFDDGAISDLKRGFEGAKQAVTEGMDRSQEASMRKSVLGRTSGRLAAGFRFVGDALDSVAGGAIRALPGGTTAMNFIEEQGGKAVKAVAESGVGQGAKAAFEMLPEGVQTAAEDLGNVAIGATSIAGGGAAPTVTKSIIKTGIKNIDDAAKQVAEAGITKTGREGIQEAFDLNVNAEALMQRVARVSKGKQAKFEERAGQSVGNYLVERDIFGTPDQIADQLVDRMRTYKGTVDRELGKIEGKHKPPQVLTAIRELEEIEADTTSIGVQGMDSQKIKDLAKKFRTQGLTLSEVNEVKRLYERNVRVNYLNPANPKPEKLVRANNLDSALRSYVERKADEGGFKNIKELNRETYLAKQLADDLGAEFAGSAGNNAVTLTDWILLAEVANSPTAAGIFMAKKFFGSETVMSATARAIARNKGIKKNVQANLGEARVNGYLDFLKRNGLVKEATEEVPETPPATSFKQGETPQTNIDTEAVKTQVQSLIQKAPEAKNHIDSIADEVSAVIPDVKVAKAPIKSEQRAIEKVINEESGNTANLRDLARNSLVPMTPEALTASLAKMDEVLAKAQADGLFARKKVQTPEKFSGYGGVIYNIETPNGLVAEIQVVEPRMIYGKMLPEDAKQILGEDLFNQIQNETGIEPGYGHKLYEDLRNLSIADLEGEKGKSLMQQSFDYYNKLR